MIKQIEAAGGTIERACNSALSQGAVIMESELKSELAQSTQSDLADRMPPFEIEHENDVFRARVGFKETPYNLDDLSDYFKAIFLNYGTPKRSKHGEETARGFIKRAKNKAKPKIQKAEEAALKTILARLKK